MRARQPCGLSGTSTPKRSRRSSELAVVLRAELVSGVDEYLHLGREATDVAAMYATPPVEASHGVDPLTTVVHHVHASASLVVEGDRVDVDLPAGRVDQHDAHRRCTGDLLVARVAKGPHESRGLVELEDEVEIVVLAGLLLEERVDAPATSSQTATPAASRMSARRATSLASIGARGSRFRYGNSMVGGGSVTPRE